MGKVIIGFCLQKTTLLYSIHVRAYQYSEHLQPVLHLYFLKDANKNLL
jgi:hypothetical protein